MLLVFHNYCRIYLYFFCPHSHVHSVFTGNGLPQFVQNLPVFFCPHSHVHSVIFCGIGLPQLLQNLPVFFCPHSHVQPDASSCCVAPEATPAAIPAAPFPGAFIPADLLFCAICVKPFIILPMVLIPMPTPMKPLHSSTTVAACILDTL